VILDLKGHKVCSSHCRMRNVSRRTLTLPFFTSPIFILMPKLQRQPECIGDSSCEVASLFNILSPFSTAVRRAAISLLGSGLNRRHIDINPESFQGDSTPPTPAGLILVQSPSFFGRGTEPGGQLVPPGDFRVCFFVNEYRVAPTPYERKVYSWPSCLFY
jgi:hypothetical protein